MPFCAIVNTLWLCRIISISRYTLQVTNIDTKFCLLKATANGFPKTCHEVYNSGGHDGYYKLDPEQDGLDPVYVYCNMSSTPITAVVYHDREEWTLVNGMEFEEAGSYDGQVGFVITRLVWSKNEHVKHSQ